jgi:hypothetical protein
LLPRPAWWIGALILGVAVALMLWPARVITVGERNTGYCRRCKYDLSGTIAAKIERCPECGLLIRTSCRESKPGERAPAN